ncbi:MAG TPA: pyridoxal-phosphate dependent enzyme [Gaiellaceae bacterium]|nr:pyridoxal-phosphate dependent enzyme [Gaiellaceae bacterium]
MSEPSSKRGSRLVCAGCGAEPARDDPYPFTCPNAGRDDDVDHVLRRELDLAAVEFPAADDEPNPYVRFRGLLHAYHRAREGGIADEEFVALVRALDDRVAEVDGHGFSVTPFAREDALGAEVGAEIWVKDETGNVSGSHKARHLFGVLVWLEVVERLGLADPADRPDLAIASCGNAALAAAVVAAAGRRRLRVFVPVDADPAVMARLEALGALIAVCPREPGVAGDPTVHALMEAIDAGALPFTCQGNLNGLAVEGGETLAWEIAASGAPIDRIVVQVGGGALASACAEGLREAAVLGAIAASPRLDTIQTEGAWPLKRAYDRLGDRDIAYAVSHRAELMWPWEQEPHSIAHGILDDETYDWVAVVEGMRDTGGIPVVVDEPTLACANELGRATTGIDVDPTGSSGLAGLLALRERGEVGDDEHIAVLFTGVSRTHHDETKETTDAELSGSRHPVAEGL